MQNEPVRRWPMAGIAIAYRGPCGYGVGDCRELRLRLQPVRLRIIESRAVDIQRARNMTIGLQSRRLFLADEERCRPRINERCAALLLDGFDIGGFGQDAFVDRCRKNLWRWSFYSALQRQTCLPPGGNTAVENGDVFDAGIFHGPISTG